MSKRNIILIHKNGKKEIIKPGTIDYKILEKMMLEKTINSLMINKKDATA